MTLLHSFREGTFKRVVRFAQRLLYCKSMGRHVVSLLSHFSTFNYQVDVRGVSIRLLVSNWIEHFRAESYKDKEPETLDWVQGNLAEPEDVLYDIGANVGVYSLFAGALCKDNQRVFSFEPESLNFSRLNSNIHLNGLDDKITAYPIALSDSSGYDILHISDFTAGAAFNSVGGEALDKTVARRQGTSLATLDDMIYTHGFPMPTMIKIDVDGIESRIIKGAQKTLLDPRLRTILVEIDSAEDSDIPQALKLAGFSLEKTGDQEGTAVNYIYVRKTDTAG